MTPQPWKQTIKIRLILSNISKSKNNQKMKFGHLLEYNMRNIFLKNSYAKGGGENIPRSFFKKIKIEHISRSIV